MNELVTHEFLESLFGEDAPDVTCNWRGDNLVQGIDIFKKYVDHMETDIIGGAGHDEVYGPSVDDMIEAGMTKDDARELQRLNWMITDESFGCFV